MGDLKAKYGDRLWLAELDLSEIASIRGVVDRAWAALDRIDVVVSNAGYGLMGAAEELTDEQVRHQIDTNLVGSIQLVRAALPHLRAQGGGRMLQLSSMGSQVAFPAFRSITPVNRASKASLMQSHRKWPCHDCRRAHDLFVFARSRISDQNASVQSSMPASDDPARWRLPPSITTHSPVM
jgi:NAD(P)-dependent dehydrogenase (short-subunit alcohol dehydrogenase family)